MEIVIGIVIGLLLGALLGALIATMKWQNKAQAVTQRLAIAEADLERSQQALTDFESGKEALNQARVTISQLETRLESEQKRMEEKLQEFAELKQQSIDTFKALSGEALKNNNQQFLELARETLGRFQQGAQGDLEKRQQAITELVKPLQETLKNVDGKIVELEKAREGAYASLREQIKSLSETQFKLQGETANLVRALRTPNVRGRWGEIQLERTVQFAGMVEHVDFVQQESTTTEEGRLRPDLLVNLPNGNRIVVDAKAPLSAYLEALETDEPTARLAQLQHHARQIRDHIKKLGSKQYWRQFEPAPEFVVLFIPGEAFFSAALEQDPELIEFGTSENVIIATPTTLIALLKAVAYGWRQEQIAQQARQISDLGRDLYERLATMGGHFEKLGNALDRSVRSYNESIRSLDTRVMVAARRFKELAPITDKEIGTLPTIESSPQPSRTLSNDEEPEAED